MSLKYADAILFRPLSARQTTRAEAGIIERIELFNFMCHKRLDVHLGPNTNFIVGHNGSECLSAAFRAADRLLIFSYP
jgi:structural maintenance of chromosomes protein 6